MIDKVTVRIKRSIVDCFLLMKQTYILYQVKDRQWKGNLEWKNGEKC